MTITIHRGIDQIGGCITEIATDRTRILIDLGRNLPDAEGESDDKIATPKAIERSADYANLPIGEELTQKIITSSTTVGDVVIELNSKE
jgi:hypothetical protein